MSRPTWNTRACFITMHRKCDDGKAIGRLHQPLVFVAWQEHHLAIFRDRLLKDPNTLYFPLNQKAADPLLASGGKLFLPGFWDLLRIEDLLALDDVADRFARAWQADPYRYEALRAWIWAREAEWTKRLLGSLETSLVMLPRYIVPWRSPRGCGDWHGASLAPQVALAEWCQAESREIIRIADPCGEEAGHSGSLSSCADITSLTDKRWILFSGFGVPDLIFNIERAMRGNDAEIVLWPDWNEPGLLTGIEKFVAATAGRVRVLEAPQGLPSGELTAPFGSGLLGQWLCDSREDLSAAERVLASLFAQMPPMFCVFSDHDCARTRLLFEICDRKDVPIIALPHSSWPMADPFLTMPHAPRQKCTYLAATRRGARALAARLQSVAKVPPSPIPSPRYRITFPRCARALWRCLTPRVGPIRVGIVVTTGEAVVAPDIALSEVAASLRMLTEIPAQLAEQVVLLGRLRDTEDRIAVLREICAISADRIRWEGSSERPPVMFLRDLDVIIELGNPGSIMLESFAQSVPFLRGGPVSRRRVDLMLPEFLVPRLSPEDPWSSLGPLVASSRKRSILALRQFRFLLRDVGGKAAQVGPSVLQYAVQAH